MQGYLVVLRGVRIGGREQVGYGQFGFFECWEDRKLENGELDEV